MGARFQGSLAPFPLCEVFSKNCNSPFFFFSFFWRVRCTNFFFLCVYKMPNTQYSISVSLDDRFKHWCKKHSVHNILLVLDVDYSTHPYIITSQFRLIVLTSKMNNYYHFHFEMRDMSFGFVTFSWNIFLSEISYSSIRKKSSDTLIKVKLLHSIARRCTFFFLLLFRAGNQLNVSSGVNFFVFFAPMMSESELLGRKNVHSISVGIGR